MLLNLLTIIKTTMMIVLPDDEDITYFTSEGDHTGRSSNDYNNKKREHVMHLNMLKALFKHMTMHL